LSPTGRATREKPAAVVIDGHAGEGLPGRDVADVAAHIDLAAASGAAFADLIDLVLEGHHGALLGEVLLQAAVVGQAAAVVEIAGGQGGEDGFAVQDEAGGAVAADDVALLAERIESGFEEGVPRGADAEGGLLGGILDIIDIGLELAAQEMYERVQFYTLDLQEVLRAEAAGAEQGAEQRERAEECFHRAEDELRTASQ